MSSACTMKKQLKINGYEKYELTNSQKRVYITRFLLILRLPFQYNGGIEFIKDYRLG